MKSLVKNHNIEESHFKPQLTSLIDVMTILLVFLIKSFSVEGNIVTPAKDLTLPDSQAKKAAESSLSLEISQSSISHDGTVIVTIRELAASDSLMVPELYNSLVEKKEKISSSSKKILLQCDKGVKFNILKQIMYTCSKAGFSEYSVLVITG